jgi:hypothetical protein
MLKCARGGANQIPSGQTNGDAAARNVAVGGSNHGRAEATQAAAAQRHRQQSSCEVRERHAQGVTLMRMGANAEVRTRRLQNDCTHASASPHVIDRLPELARQLGAQRVEMPRIVQLDHTHTRRACQEDAPVDPEPVAAAGWLRTLQHRRRHIQSA